MKEEKGKKYSEDRSTQSFFLLLEIAYPETLEMAGKLARFP